MLRLRANMSEVHESVPVLSFSHYYWH